MVIRYWSSLRSGLKNEIRCDAVPERLGASETVFQESIGKEDRDGGAGAGRDLLTRVQWVWTLLQLS